MKGRCTYTLSTGQIFAGLARRCLLATMLLSFLAVGGAVGYAVQALIREQVTTGGFVSLIVSILVADLACTFLFYFFLYRKAAKSESPPAGTTVLDWSPAGVALRADTTVLTCRWEEVRLQDDGRGTLILCFPDGRFTLVSEKQVSREDRESLRNAADAARRWSSGTLMP